ncbi:hypothetical protein LJR267_002943 [Paraburkholderia hospita]|uniref:hypothetical protein n=1 Tax=Paraburkholderia hospita TaxID=169430 RepID=UPI003ECDDEBF
MRRVLRDVIEFVAHRVELARVVSARVSHMDRFETPPHRAVLRARPAMQFGALAIAQERLSEASTRRSCSSGRSRCTRPAPPRSATSDRNAEVPVAAVMPFQSFASVVGQAIAGAVAGQTSVDAALKAGNAAADCAVQQAGYQK